MLVTGIKEAAILPFSLFGVLSVWDTFKFIHENNRRKESVEPEEIRVSLENPRETESGRVSSSPVEESKTEFDKFTDILAQEIYARKQFKIADWIMNKHENMKDFIKYSVGDIFNKHLDENDVLGIYLSSIKGSLRGASRLVYLISVKLKNNSEFNFLIKVGKNIRDFSIRV